MSNNNGKEPKKFIQNPQHQTAQYKTPPKPSPKPSPIYKPANTNTPTKPPLTPNKPPIHAAPLSKPNSPNAPIRITEPPIYSAPNSPNAPIQITIHPEPVKEDSNILKKYYDIIEIHNTDKPEEKAPELPDIYPEDKFEHNFRLNYRFQSTDARDYIHTPTSYQLQAVSSTSAFSLANKISIVLNQGDIGACVANATKQYILICTNQHFQLSRLFHYYCGRLLSGESNLEDTGLDIRSACKIISKSGVGAVPESSWPYDTSQVTTMPPINVFKTAKFFQQYTYTFIQPDLVHLKSYLLNMQRPIMFGMIVYSSFMSQTVAATGQVPVPNTQTEKNEGGHCTLIVGYDDNKQQFECVNSWGVEWGDKGFFYLPYEIVANPQLCSDFVGMTFVY